jgi:peptidoglycan/LPS O-acetylase OafA/YrhL
MISHSVCLIPNPDNIRALALGNVGVFLFFTLSGFVITEALETFYKGRTTEFLINRFLKIYPAYWSSLFISVVILYVVNDPNLSKFNFLSILGNLILVGQYFKLTDFSVISITWAVVVEIEFYVAAAIIFAFTSYQRRKWIFPITLVIATALYAYVSITSSYTRYFGNMQFAPFFILGSTLFYIKVPNVPRTRVSDCMIPFFFFILSIHSFVVYNMHNQNVNIVGAISIFMSLFIIYFYLINFKATSSMEKIDKQLGNMTYFLYLIHISIILFFEKTFVHQWWLIPLLLAVMCCITLSFLLYRLIEFPIMTVRDRFRGKRLYT